MTLTLDIPTNLDAAKRERLAVALRDADLISPDQAVRLTDTHETSDLGRAEWEALLRRLAESGPRGVALPVEDTRRESIYGDDGR